MNFKGNSLMRENIEHITTTLQILSAEEVIALCASLTATGELLEEVMESKIPSMSLSSAFYAFTNCGNENIRRMLWGKRFRDADDLSSNDLCVIAIFTSKARHHYISSIHQEATEKLFAMDNIGADLLRIIEEAASLREKAFAKILEQYPMKDLLMRCLKIQELRVPSFNKLIKKGLLDKNDLEALRNIPGIKLQVSRLLKEYD